MRREIACDVVMLSEMTSEVRQPSCEMIEMEFIAETGSFVTMKFIMGLL